VLRQFACNRAVQQPALISAKVLFSLLRTGTPGMLPGLQVNYIREHGAAAAGCQKVKMNMATYVVLSYTAETMPFFLPLP